MYQEEANHFDAPHPDFVNPPPDGKLNLNPIAMTRMGLSWRGAKEFNDAYAVKRHARLTQGQVPAKEAELFSGTHLMHPGTCPIGLTSSAVNPAGLNPHHGPHARSEAARHYQDPREYAAQTRALVDARRRWLEGEAEDAAAVLAEEKGLSKHGREYAERERGSFGGGGRGGFRRPPAPPGAASAKPPCARRKHAPQRPAAHGMGFVASMGTSFVFRRDLAYETASRPSFGHHATAGTEGGGGGDAAWDDSSAQPTSSSSSASRAGAALLAEGKGTTRAGRSRGGGGRESGLHGGMIRSLRDIKYGEFTAECDLPHRHLDLHPIGF